MALRAFALLVLVTLVTGLLPSHAQNGIRSLEPIVGAAGKSQGMVPVPISAVESFIYELAAAWNQQRLEPYLHPDYPNRARVIAGLPGRAVPGTQLRILSVGPVQTVEQTRSGNALTSTVVARIRAEMEIPEADGGFRRRSTTQELIIRVVRQVPE